MHLSKGVWKETCQGCYKHFPYHELKHVRIYEQDWREWYGEGMLFCTNCNKKHITCKVCKRSFLENKAKKINYVNNKCGLCSKEIDFDIYLEMLGEQDFVKPRQFHSSKGVFKRKPKDDIFFGIELEAELPTNPSEKNRFWPKDFERIFKDKADVDYDGSLTNGLEMRGDPMTYEVLYKSKMWDKLFAEQKKKQCFIDRHRNAGMHIHVSNNAITEGQAKKILAFFIKNQTIVELIAERRANTYTQYRAEEFYSHYGAVNKTSHGTYEFRIFQSVICKENFYKNVDFVKALVDFFEENPRVKLTMESFLTFVYADRTKYKHLRAFLNKLRANAAIVKEEMKKCLA